MTLNKPLLFGSLAVAAVLGIGGGYLVSRTGDDPERLDAVLTSTATPDLAPTLDTNAAVAGTALPNVALDTFAGDAVRTADLIGTPLILNFWTSTCVPCKKELPDFAAIHAEFGDAVRIVGVNSLGPAKSEEDFARDRGVNYELLYDSNGEFAAKVGLAAQPVTLFVAADGTIVRQTGEIDAARLRTLINELLL